MGFRVWGLGFGVEGIQGFGCKAWVLEIGVWGWGFGVWCFGCRIQGLGSSVILRVEGTLL